MLYSPPVVEQLAVLFIRKDFSMFTLNFPCCCLSSLLFFLDLLGRGKILLYVLILYLDHIAKNNYQLFFQPFFCEKK